MIKAGLIRTQLRTVALTSIAILLRAVWMARPSSFLFPQQQHERPCRCFPGDNCWPSLDEWADFNKTIGGKLISTIPVASPCHDDFPGVDYDPDKCAQVKGNWERPEFHIETTHSPMAAYFANLSCDPFTPRDAQCIVGAYVPYVVNASDADDYRKTIAFAKERNIRLVIRNTGHDYMGKSTGAGALAIWTHNIKGRSIIDYASTGYTGKAMKTGAGVLASEAIDTAKAEGLVVVGGDCPRGGTSPLGTKFGLAADQVLEWEVVTGKGELLTATPTENQDLYWALSGGGGGTYGVVLSMTVMLHQDGPTAGAILSFTEPSDKFWDIVQVFLMNLPAVLDAGATLYAWYFPGNKFLMPQSYLLGGTSQDLQLLLQPTLKALDESGIPYTWEGHDYPTFQDSFYAQNPKQDVAEINLGGRLIPRSLVKSSDSAASLADAIKSVLDNGGGMATVCSDTSRPPTFPNSAHPAWRETLFLVFLYTIYDRYNMTTNILNKQKVTDVLDPAFEKLTPGGAVYLNEADINHPDWPDAFYGPNYATLAAIKKLHDPDDIFWGPTAVGSESWEVAADGRLCKISS
ncbi:FAD binding domain protein [Daldinia caldariorum]|uniref:FAD binding domain protein n=1 Tax=Daldinia caldariorum TaxID=326644 RepID=UPI0020076003|nr:FAD binding domain protein [Daldinia caldariorum]KAI1467956.1 FAD binding domain protein [Daldinia caldariorum]